MRDYVFSLSPGETEQRAVVGRFVRVKSADGEIRIQAENRDGRIVADLAASAGLRFAVPEQFERIRVTNDGAAAVAATLTVGFGEVDDSSVVGSIAVTNQVAVDVAVPTSISDYPDIACPDGASTQVYSSVTGYDESILQAHPDNTGPIIVGSTNVLGQGVVLQPGDMIVLKGGPKVKVKNQSGATQYVKRLRVVK